MTGAVDGPGRHHHARECRNRRRAAAKGVSSMAMRIGLCCGQPAGDRGALFGAEPRPFNQFGAWAAGSFALT
jgi:hypothetical protein